MIWPTVGGVELTMEGIAAYAASGLVLGIAFGLLLVFVTLFYGRRT